MIKIYILLDEYLNSEHITEFVEAFDNAEELARYMEDHQEDGHRFKIETREFHNPTAPSDYPWTSPTTPQPLDLVLRHEKTYPLENTLQWPPCMNGGPCCTNPQHDCINCPMYSGYGKYSSHTNDFVTTTTTDGTKELDYIKNK